MGSNMARLVGTDQIFKYRSLRRDLATVNIFSDEGFIRSAGKKLQNTVFQQKISTKFLSGMYFDAFYLAKRPLTSKFVPVPKNWIKKTEINLKKNISIYSIYSWRIYLIFIFINAAKKSFFAKKFILDSDPENSFQIIIDPRDVKIPSLNILLPEYSFINWLSKERFPQEKFSITDGIRTVNSHYGQIGHIKSHKTAFVQRFFNITVNLYMIFLTLAEIIVYRQWKSLLVLEEIVYKKKIELNLDCKKPIIALFSNSFGPCRPLWTTAQVKYGVKAINYFYSLDLEPRIFGSSMPQDTLLPIATWDEYWLIDTAQRNRLDTVLNPKAKVHLTGFPWMFDSILRNFSQSDYLKIAMFDIAFKDDYVGWSTHYPYGLAGQEFNEEFVTTVLDLAKQYNFQVFHKRKIQSSNSVKYTKFIDGLQKEFPKHLLNVSAHTSPIRLAKVVDGSISQPYTSTGQLCHYYTNSVYFNPKKNELGLVVNPSEILELNKVELEIWINCLLEKKNSKI